MKIVDSPISWDDLASTARDGLGNLVKAVVDVERKIMAIDGELFVDYLVNR